MAEADMQRLQQEALRRVQEMQARAQAAAQSSSNRDHTPRSNTPGGNRNPMGPGGYGNSGNSGGSRSQNSSNGGHSNSNNPGYGRGPQGHGAPQHSSSSNSVPPGREYTYRNTTGGSPPSENRSQRRNTSGRGEDGRSTYTDGADEKSQGPEEQENPEEAAEQPSDGITDIFQALFQDSDRTIILILLLLVMEEKGDPSLPLALMYLLM